MIETRSTTKKPSVSMLFISAILNFFMGVAFVSFFFKRLPKLNSASGSEAFNTYALLGCGIVCFLLGFAILYRYFFPKHVRSRALAKKMSADIQRELMIQLFREVPLEDSADLRLELTRETDRLVESRLPELRASYKWPADESMRQPVEEMAKTLLAKYSTEQKRKLADAFYRRNWGRDRNLAFASLAVAAICVLFIAFHFDLP